MLIRKLLAAHNAWSYRRKKKILKERFPTSNVSISATVEQSVLEGNNVIGEAVNVSRSHIGFATVIGNDSKIPNSVIGRFCSISWNVRTSVATHPLDMVSTYPSFFNTTNDYPFGKGKVEKTEFLATKDGLSVRIGNDVWIGEGVLIKGGVTIGDGAVIGMNAVVTRDVPPYSIVGGVPAKIIRYRMKPHEIDQMLKIKWWDWSTDTIRERREDFTDLDSFIKKYGTEDPCCNNPQSQ